MPGAAGARRSTPTRAACSWSTWTATAAPTSSRAGRPGRRLRWWPTACGERFGEPRTVAAPADRRDARAARGRHAGHRPARLLWSEPRRRAAGLVRARPAGSDDAGPAEAGSTTASGVNTRSTYTHLGRRARARPRRRARVAQTLPLVLPLVSRSTGARRPRPGPETTDLPLPRRPLRRPLREFAGFGRVDETPATRPCHAAHDALVPYRPRRGRPRRPPRRRPAAAAARDPRTPPPAGELRPRRVARGGPAVRSPRADLDSLRRAERGRHHLPAAPDQHDQLDRRARARRGRHGDDRGQGLGRGLQRPRAGRDQRRGGRGPAPPRAQDRDRLRQRPDRALPLASLARPAARRSRATCWPTPRPSTTSRRWAASPRPGSSPAGARWP